METKMDSEQISLMNYRKGENTTKNKGSSIHTSNTDGFFFCDLCRYKCKKNVFKRSIRT